MTVCSWGLYGVFLHTGQMAMGDAVNGRYKAFLFVGLAYLLTAVVGSLIVLAVQGASWSFTAKGMTWSTLAGVAGGAGRIRRPAGFWSKGDAVGGDVDCVCRSADCECGCGQWRCILLPGD